MDIAQTVNFSGYSASVYNKIKSVSQVETAKEVNKADIINAENILITAGASTPDWVISEVAKKVKEIKEEKK